jgi:hypothetical protein
VIDKVLLAGDGWWAEPSIGEWLWVGDYVWSPGDRGGRLSLAVSADIDGARWVMLIPAQAAHHNEMMSPAVTE